MIVIAFGANLVSHLGPPMETIRAALSELPERGIRTLAVSSFYRTEAWPDPSDPPYMNAIAIVDTDLEPRALMDAIHAIESEFGRIRDRPNAPRTLDMDLLDYNGRVQSGDPALPHPRMSDRAFVLVPLAEVAPKWVHPISGKDVAVLLQELPDSALAKIRRLST